MVLVLLIYKTVKMLLVLLIFLTNVLMVSVLRKKNIVMITSPGVHIMPDISAQTDFVSVMNLSVTKMLNVKET